MTEVHLAESAGQVPEVGQPMPDFSLLGTDGNVHTIGDLTRDQRGMVLFFFPKANTSG
jgi:peroxiredoxin